jgi:hypothetical protein
MDGDFFGVAAPVASRDVFHRRHPDAVKFPFQFALPVIKEPAQYRVSWDLVEVLPKIALQKIGMVGHAVKNFRRGQPIAIKLPAKIFGGGQNTVTCHSFRLPEHL